ncbi:hypothetical protein Tco_1076382, partial [Tanacetum coccineum]
MEPSSSPSSLIILKSLFVLGNSPKFFAFLVREFVCTLPNGQNGMDSNPDIYPPPHEESLLIREAMFNQRPLGKTCKVKGVDITLVPFQMVLSELKTNLMKWEIILSENA